MMTLPAGRFTPAARVLVATRTLTDPVVGVHWIGGEERRGKRKVEKTDKTSVWGEESDHFRTPWYYVCDRSSIEKKEGDVQRVLLATS
jgi:hypothetical protein